jgi:glycosyltransferase involved in cell wall biosynthesis
MRRGRVMMLCYFYPPLAGGGVHRMLGFTRHLPQHGWDCTVIAAGPDDYWVTDQALMRQIPEGTEVIRVGGGSAISAWLKLRGGDRGRRSGRVFGGLRALSDWWLLPDSYVGWARRAARAAARRLARGGVDALLSSSPPDSVHLAAAARHRDARLPWVADFRDPWIGLHFRQPPTAWHRARQARLEQQVIDGADVLLAASRTHAAELSARTDPRRVVHLPNGFEPAARGTEPPPSPSMGDRESAFRLAFTGTLSLMPDTETLLEALHDLLARRPEARRRIRARLAGPFDAGYEDRAIALGLRGIVEFTGPLSHVESRALQRDADLLLLWKPRATPTMVPGKLYEYLDAGRPLVAVLESQDEAADLVRRGGGVVTPPGDRVALAEEIERRYLEWRERGRRPDARPDWLAAHTRERLAGDLAQVLDRLTAGGR